MYCKQDRASMIMKSPCPSDNFFLEVITWSFRLKSFTPLSIDCRTTVFRGKDNPLKTCDHGLVFR